MSNSGSERSEPGERQRTVLLANPRGFCAGVDRAIDAVEATLAHYGSPIYVRRPIVHNRAVTKRLESGGAIFVQEVDDVPDGSVLVMSAHGVAPAVMASARTKSLKVVDATCPLVTKVHTDVVAHHRDGRIVILIGHPGHPEIIGTLGQVPSGAAILISSLVDLGRVDRPRDTRIAYAVQTTFSVRDARGIIEAIKQRFDDVAGPRSGNICYATTNRQAAIELIAGKADYVIVVGDRQSSNANRLVEVAVAAGCSKAVLANSAQDLDWPAINAARTIGMTAAASTPALCVEEICEALAGRGFSIQEQNGILETVSFKNVEF